MTFWATYIPKYGHKCFMYACMPTASKKQAAICHKTEHISIWRVYNEKFQSNSDLKKLFPYMGIMQGDNADFEGRFGFLTYGFLYVSNTLWVAIWCI